MTPSGAGGDALGRPKDLAKRAFFATCRGLATVVPPGLLYFMFLPYSALRGLRAALRERRVPASRIPAPPDDRPGFVRRWRFQTAIHQRWLPLLWSDKWHVSRWQSRFEAHGRELLDDLRAERPIVVVTIHTGAFLVLGGWLMHQGIGVGSVIVDRRIWQQTLRYRARNAGRWQRFGDSAAFRAGDTRSMLRYLAPGRALVLAPDHLHGHRVEGEWKGGRMTISSGAFRVARLTRAAALPIVVTDAGRWRFRIDICAPVPNGLIDAEDDVGAASHVARQLMPIVAARPDQAAVTLVSATRP